MATPDPSHVPGASGIQSAINVIAVFTLLARLAGCLLGGAVWAIGNAPDTRAAGSRICVAARARSAL